MLSHFLKNAPDLSSSQFFSRMSHSPDLPAYYLLMSFTSLSHVFFFKQVLLNLGSTFFFFFGKNTSKIVLCFLLRRGLEKHMVLVFERVRWTSV